MRSYFKRPLEDWSSIFFKLMTFIQWRWNEHKKLPSMFCTIYICGRIFFIFLHFQKWLLKFHLSIWCLLYCLSLYMTKNIEDMYCLLQVYRLGGGCSWWPTCIFPTVNILEIHTRIIHVKIISNLLAHILCNSRICSFMIYLILLWDGWWKSKINDKKLNT